MARGEAVACNGRRVLADMTNSSKSGEDAAKGAEVVPGGVSKVNPDTPHVSAFCTQTSARLSCGNVTEECSRVLPQSALHEGGSCWASISRPWTSASSRHPISATFSDGPIHAHACGGFSASQFPVVASAPGPQVVPDLSWALAMDEALIEWNASASCCSGVQQPFWCASPISRHADSSVARALSARRRFFQDPEEAIHGVMDELVDSVLRNSHIQSQGHLPDAAALLSNIGSSQRESILVWLIQACDIMRFHDDVLHAAVLTLDRYCAAVQEQMPMEKMQKVLMAVICTVLKTTAVADEVTMPLRDLLVHISRGQISFEDILTMECKVLQTLLFEVSAPTSLDFLDAFCVPLIHADEPLDGDSDLRSLADFLLQLSWFDAHLHYRYPHAVLAASAVHVALCTLRPDSSDCLKALLNALATTCPEVSDLRGCVDACASELHSMWTVFANTQGSKAPCLLRKFGNARSPSLPGVPCQHRQLVLSPPAASELFDVARGLRDEDRLCSIYGKMPVETCAGSVRSVGAKDAYVGNDCYSVVIEVSEESMPHNGDIIGCNCLAISSASGCAPVRRRVASF